jgi:hypothetical protein
MSHELRTPLNAIILYSELLQEEAEDRPQPSSVADLKKINAAGKHLLELINGILDLSKIEAGKMTLSLESFDVRAMIHELVDTVGPLVRQNGNQLTVRCADDLGTMHADLMKTRQILLNLLSNAIKFTRDGAIRVDVAHDRRRGAVDRVRGDGYRHGDDAGAVGQDFRSPSQADRRPANTAAPASACDRVALLPADGRRHFRGKLPDRGSCFVRLPIEASMPLTSP